MSFFGIPSGPETLHSEWVDSSIPSLTHRIILLGITQEVVWEVRAGERVLRRLPGWINGSEAATEWADRWRATGRDNGIAQQVAKDSGYTGETA